MISETRRARMADVAAARLLRVRCAAEAVHHRHNVSAILRTCDALGIHHVHLVAPRRMKVSEGPARGAERWLALHHHRDSVDAIRSLQQDGVRVYVADLEGAAVSPHEVPVHEPVCVWLGAELAGVSAEARAAADGVVRLPMFGFAQSLNVSVAAAMVLQTVAHRARQLGPEALLPPRERDQLLESWIAREEPMRAAIAKRDARS